MPIVPLAATATLRGSFLMVSSRSLSDMSCSRALRWQFPGSCISSAAEDARHPALVSFRFIPREIDSQIEQALAHRVAATQLDDGNALVHRRRNRVIAVGDRSKDLHPHGLLEILEPDVGGLFFVPIQNEPDLVARVIEIAEQIEQSLAVADKGQGE